MNRRTQLAIGILFFITISGCAGSRMNIAGNWTSTEGGGMTINQNGSDITGKYTMKEGAILGKLSDNTLTGYWFQNSSGKRCSNLRNSTYYWGALQLIFTNSSFSGKWGYCDDPQNTPWTGVRK